MWYPQRAKFEIDLECQDLYSNTPTSSSFKKYPGWAEKPPVVEWLPKQEASG